MLQAIKRNGHDPAPSGRLRAWLRRVAVVLFGFLPEIAHADTFVCSIIVNSREVVGACIILAAFFWFIDHQVGDAKAHKMVISLAIGFVVLGVIIAAVSKSNYASGCAL